MAVPKAVEIALFGPEYAELGLNAATMAKAWKSSLNTNEMTKLESYKDTPPSVPTAFPQDPRYDEQLQKYNAEGVARYMMAKSLISRMAAEKMAQGWYSMGGLSKAGVTTQTGYNFYDLRGPVRMLFPVNTPMRNRIPRIGRQNDGFGTAAHWKVNRNVGSSYAGASEGQRVARGTPDNIDYTAIYKTIGIERGVSFEAQFAGEGLADNRGDEHIRGLFQLQLQEEGLIWHGNSGNTSGGTGFRLGQCPTPTGAINSTRSAGAPGNLSSQAGADLPFGSALTTSSYVSACCVLLTAMGNPATSQYGYNVAPTIASGLTPYYVRNNIDGSKDNIAGGTSAISAQSAITQATSGNLTIKFQIPAASLPIKGCFGYAWYIDVESSSTQSLGACKFAGITTVPFCYVSGTPLGTQPANATNGSLPGLTTDCSYNTMDFDGLITYAATTVGAYWLDKQGNTLTSNKDGTVDELETALLTIAQQYQTGIDEIWCSYDVCKSLNSAIRYSGTNAAAYQFMYGRDSQNNILGGFVVSAYQSKYAINSPTGAAAIPIRVHPMMPPGTMYLNVLQNPYPHSRVPYVAGMLVQRDYYSIEWPQVTREWPHGTYVHECLAHEMPWIPGVITGIGPFVGS